MENWQKILIIEDDSLLGEILTKQIRENEMKASLAKDAETALKIIDQEIPALILMDLILPRMSGEEFLKALKDKGIVPKLPVIVLSNFSDEKKIQECMELGAREFLVKSNFDLSEIVKKVKDILLETKQPAQK